MAKIPVHAVLGVDAGGTFTRYVVYDLEGNEIDRIIGDSIHFMKVGFDGMRKELDRIRAQFDYSFDFVGIGTAGYGKDPVIRKQIEDAIYPVFPNAHIMSDAQFAMLSALEGELGVYCISGTGSIAFLGEERRGGFGYLIGDEGSAFWIGKEILLRFTQEADSRKPRTELYDAVMLHFGIDDPYEIISLMAKGPYREKVASLAQMGASIDAIQDVYEAAGKELGGLINGFHVDKPTTLALGGSVLIHNKVVKKSLLRAIDSLYELKEATNPVEYAAVILYNKQKAQS